MSLLHLDNDYDTEIAFTYSGEATHNRNSLIEQFLQTDYEWLLFLDNDIMPPFNIFEMTKNNVNICSGVYHQWISDKVLPMIYRIKDDNYQPLNAIPCDDLIEVDGVGAGCLLIDRLVFEMVKKPYFKIEYDDKGMVSLGHDLYFCDKAREEGFKIYVDTRMICNHYKTVNMNAVNEYKDK